MDDTTPDPDLQALMDRVLAAVRREAHGYQLDGMIVVIEVDGRGVTVGVDLEDPELLLAHLQRLAYEIEKRL